ncbi:autotransporter outer membrane beta-barrel domain-containing protein [Pantoea sp. C2G6]|uniref:autotransporter outer membrane beta-barrel domain-containing protein n=1 Tax=Pantoea sp. C2G6 TaxID=3243084 RepID=UPI003EDA0085
MENNTQSLLLVFAIAMTPTPQANAAYSAVVDAGQTVDGETVEGKDGQQFLNGTANNTTILKGTQFVFGTANNTTLVDGTQYIVYDGVTNVVNMTGGKLPVNGVANDVVASGGMLSINIGLNGTEDPTTGGVINRAILSGTALLENRFGIDNDTVVNSGGHLQTGSDFDNGWIDTGISKNAVINDGGLQTVDNHGTSIGSVVNKGGMLKVLYFLHNVTDMDKVGTQFGTANNSVIYGEMQNTGGIDNNTHIMSGGTFLLQGSIADNIVAISNNATLENDSQATLYENAQANNWLINGGTDGAVTLEDDTSAINDSTVNSGSLVILKGTATNTIINDGQMKNSGGADIDTVINGGIYSLGDSEAATSSNLLIENGALANIYSGTVSDSTINGSMFVYSNSSDSETTSTLQGNVAVNEGGQLTLFSGVNTQNADLTLAGTGNLYLAESAAASGGYNFALGAVNMNGGSIYFGTPESRSSIASYSSLTMKSLDGTGSFYMNSDLSSLSGNFLTVQGEANGDFNVYVADTGISPTAAADLKMVQTGGGTADFTLANSGNVVDLGTYQYFLVADGNGGWALSPAAQQDTTPQVDPTDPVTPQEPTVDPVLPDAPSDTDTPSSDDAGTDTAAPGDTGTDTAAPGDAGTDTATPGDTGTDPATPGDAGTDTAAPDDAGTDTAAPDDAGTDTAAPGDAGTDPAAPDDAGTDPATPDDADTDTAAGDTVPAAEQPANTPTLPATPMITPSARAVLSMAAVDPLIFRTELNAVRNRLDQVRSYSHDANVWGHYTTSRLKVNNSAGANFNLDINGVTIGADQAQDSGNGILSSGLFFSYSRSDIDFYHSGSGKADSYSVGAYAGYRDNSGYYVDGIVKLNRFRNDVNARMTSGAAADGNYHASGLGMNLEAGKYFTIDKTYIAPYAAVMGYTGTSQDYTLSNGMKAHVGSQQSVIGEAGVNLGHDFSVQGTQIQPYLKLAIEREFIDDNAVRVNSDHFSNDVSGTRGTYQVGINARLTDRLAVHTDAGYSSGSKLESPWSANLGVSWSF